MSSGSSLKSLIRPRRLAIIVANVRPGGTDDVKNGYKLTLNCIDCGVTFAWSVLPKQLLAAKIAKPSRCPSCRRKRRERVWITQGHPYLSSTSDSHLHRGNITACKLIRHPNPSGIQGHRNPTNEEIRAGWTPFTASSGTYDIAGSTLTMRPIVAKNPGGQGKATNRATVKVEKDNLWFSLIETPAGKIQYPSTSKDMRVE